MARITPGRGSDPGLHSALDRLDLEIAEAAACQREDNIGGA